MLQVYKFHLSIVFDQVLQFIKPFNLILQPIPFTADTLLGSFYKLPDGSILVGGKEATSCGINPYSGKVTGIECLIKFVVMSNLP